MPEVTLDEITAEVEVLTKKFVYSDIHTSFHDVLTIQNRLYHFLEHQQYPQQTKQLYYLTSIVGILLSTATLHLGFPKAAAKQAWASWSYAELIGHNSLRVESGRMLAWIAYLDNRPQKALDLALSATTWATEPLARAGLQSAIAYYSAHTARAEEAKSAIAQAFDARESLEHNSDLYNYFGGPFSYARPKLLQDSAATYIELGQVDRVEALAAEAVRLYENGPAEQRAFGSESLARIDLGHARLMRADAAGIEEALRPVLNLSSAYRLNSVVIRIQALNTALSRHEIGSTLTGRTLVAEIEEFVSSASSRIFR